MYDFTVYLQCVVLGVVCSGKLEHDNLIRWDDLIKIKEEEEEGSERNLFKEIAIISSVLHSIKTS